MKSAFTKTLCSILIALFVIIVPFTAFAQDEITFYIDENKAVYILDESSQRYTGSEEITVDNTTYTFENGVLKTINGSASGFLTIEGKEYLVSSGVLFTGVYSKSLYQNGIQNTTFTGYKTVNSTKYYFKKGTLATTVIKETSGSNKGKYVYIKNGLFKKKSGFLTVENNSYYFSKGIAQSGIKKIDGKKYFFSTKNMKLVKNKEFTYKKVKYIANANGVIHQKAKAFVKAESMVKKLTNKKDSDITKLYKCYKWSATRCSYAYKKGYSNPTGKKWVNNYALNMFRTRRGRCYSFAAAFAVMAREIGYDDVKVVVGKCNGFGGSYIPHAWVEVKVDGAKKVFDPEYEYRHHNKNYTKAFNKTYSNATAGYRVSKRIKVTK